MIIFILLASSFIGLGNALHPLINYSPIIGWFLGITCQLLALVVAFKWELKRTLSKQKGQP
ncbi:hypothetical protein H8S33_00545 [Ornithinibacillus sp. BX22]|uniref:Uncharacterized protein n=1 Tax=Ornithinibacillus hominis TaxID=2763055 RepID=A0A923RF80_9BACI|nr:hypothetical protein [Ornithinibacillus hominis]MBC5635300.1 hypothetical protein [Ornithinibacillus hominis]